MWAPYTHPHLSTSDQQLRTLHSQEEQWEDKNSTGNTHSDIVITGVQLIFCFRLINFPALPFSLASGAVFKQLGQNSTAGFHFLCFVAPSSGARGGQKEKQDSPEYIRAGLTLAAAVFDLFWPSLRQSHFSISMGEHPRPRLPPLPRVWHNKTQRSPVQASASKVPQADVPTADRNESQQLHAQPLPCSRDNLSSASQEGAEVKWFL